VGENKKHYEEKKTVEMKKSCFFDGQDTTLVNTSFLPFLFFSFKIFFIGGFKK